MSMTPEGDIFRTALTDAHTTAHIRVAGLRACSCGRPDCPQREAGVTVSIDDTTAMAVSPQAIEAIIQALRQASAYVWPKGGGK